MEFFDVLKPYIPLLVAILIWVLNECSKRNLEEHKRKEERYIALLKGLNAFYVDADSETKKNEKNEFIHQLNLAWLYCPDPIIRKFYNFLKCIEANGPRKLDEKKELAVAEAIVQMRSDLLGKKFWFWKKTKLKASDFRHWTST